MDAYIVSCVCNYVKDYQAIFSLRFTGIARGQGDKVRVMVTGDGFDIGT